MTNGSFLLRDGSRAARPELARLVQFDPRSRNWPLLKPRVRRPARSYTWRCRERLDQGSEGMCVGAGCGHGLIARPAEVE